MHSGGKACSGRLNCRAWSDRYGGGLVVFLVSRLNLGYNAEEDRLRLMCESATGERLLLWLTRRFVRRLLDELAKLASPAGRGLASDQSASTAQGDAVAVDRGVPPTRHAETAPAGNPCAEGFLVRRLRMRLSHGVVSLGFMGEDDAIVQLDLDSPGMQRWLELLAASCQVAQWSLVGVAPAMPGSGAGGAEHPRVLH